MHTVQSGICDCLNVGEILDWESGNWVKEGLATSSARRSLLIELKAVARDAWAAESAARKSDRAGSTSKPRKAEFSRRLAVRFVEEFPEHIAPLYRERDGPRWVVSPETIRSWIS